MPTQDILHHLFICFIVEKTIQLLCNAVICFIFILLIALLALKQLQVFAIKIRMNAFYMIYFKCLFGVFGNTKSRLPTKYTSFNDTIMSLLKILFVCTNQQIQLLFCLSRLFYLNQLFNIHFFILALIFLIIFLCTFHLFRFIGFFFIK